MTDEKENDIDGLNGVSGTKVPPIFYMPFVGIALVVEKIDNWGKSNAP
jgi:hypothetical protein